MSEGGPQQHGCLVWISRYCEDVEGFMSSRMTRMEGLEIVLFFLAQASFLELKGVETLTVVRDYDMGE